MAVKFYRDAGMWQDVLRVAKEYLPHKLPQLQDEYERDMMEKSTRYCGGNVCCRFKHSKILSNCHHCVAASTHVALPIFGILFESINY